MLEKDKKKQKEEDKKKDKEEDQEEDKEEQRRSVRTCLTDIRISYLVGISE